MHLFSSLVTTSLLTLLPLAQSDQHILSASHTPKRIAIIGAGSAGASTAYYLDQFWSNTSLPAPNITVFERNTYIGGRTTTVYANDDESAPIELGASIFVAVNRNLVSAARALNLSTAAYGPDDPLLPPHTQPPSRRVPDVGIYNGKSFVFVLDRDLVSYKDYAKLIWRYGILAPYRTMSLMKATVARFLQLYDAPHFPFASLSRVVQDLDLLAATAATGAEFLAANGVKRGALFAQEVVQASTRVNYAVDLGRIHGLEAMVCMATDGAMSVRGGNWRIFAGMLAASATDVRLGTAVRAVSKAGGEGRERGWAVRWQEEAGSGGDEEVFDHVVLAGPYQFSGIEFPDGALEHVPDAVPYVRLHVTLFTSRHQLAPRAFGLNEGEEVPSAVLTTLSDDGTGPNFLSISRLRDVAVRAPSGDIRAEHVYKVFTLQAVEHEFLARILGIADREDDLEVARTGKFEFDKDDISWIHRKEWDSYPVEAPRVTFEESKLAEGIWYTSGIESFISTMETSSLMGMNVARLIVDAESDSLLRIAASKA